MNVNLALGVAVALFAIWGAFSGAARQLAQAIAAVAAWVVASPLGELAGPFTGTQLGMSLFAGTVIATLIGFVLIFLSVRLAATAVLKRLFEGKEGKRAGLDRALGFTLGALKAALVGFIALCALSFVEEHVSVMGHRLDLSPKGSVAMRLAKEHNLFEIAHQADLDQLTALLKMSKDPEKAKRLQQSPEYQQLKKDPRFQAVLQQQAGWEHALATGDTRALMKDDALMRLVRDGELMKKVGRLIGPQ